MSISALVNFLVAKNLSSPALLNSKDVPVIFYFNGTHADYHKHTDTPDKIEYDLLENRTRLVFYSAWEIANHDKRIVVDKTTN